MKINGGKPTSAFRSAERSLQKGKSGQSTSRILQSTSYLRSTVRKMLDEDQRWGIIDEEIVVQKYNFEGEIYVLDRRTGETQN